jgi:uncharacterized protein (DUF1015 family)
MPSVRPFNALRFASAPLDKLVAPPYDVISDEQRQDYLARDPHNVVHLTLPDSPEQAAEELAAWRRDGVLVEDEPAFWWVAQDYTGPDGVARTREGFAASVEAKPYSAGEVLPHERTHAGPKEGRLRLLRATRTQLEPIFLLYDAEPPVARPDGDPDMDVEEGGVRTRLWRIPATDGVEIDTPLLIADGHHRYETAVAFREEDPRATHLMAVLVSSRAPGLEIFPTHRLVQSVGDVPGHEVAAPEGTTLYRDGKFTRVATDDDFGPRVVESFHPEGVSYTAYADEAIAAVDRGDATAAFLLEPVTFEQIARFTSAGEVMPQKSTFFYPKLTSGLLFHPIG